MNQLLQAFQQRLHARIFLGKALDLPDRMEDSCVVFPSKGLADLRKGVLRQNSSQIHGNLAWLGYSNNNQGFLSKTFDVNFSWCKTLMHEGTVMYGSDDRGVFDIIMDIDDVFDCDGSAL